MIVFRVLLVTASGEGRDAMHALRSAGYDLEFASCRASVADRIRASLPDVIVVDERSHCCRGADLCRVLCGDSRLGRIPIVLLSDSTSDTDTVLALELGADDYIAMPVGPAVLCARVEAVLRRSTSKPVARPYEVEHGLAIQPGRTAVSMDGESVLLTRDEVEILSLLAERPNMVMSSDAILSELSQRRLVKTHSVDVSVSSLRKKLREHGACIETVRGGGYCFRSSN